jgi:hypothetical protein
VVLEEVCEKRALILVMALALMLWTSRRINLAVHRGSYGSAEESMVMMMMMMMVVVVVVVVDVAEVVVVEEVGGQVLAQKVSN